MSSTPSSLFAGLALLAVTAAVAQERLMIYPAAGQSDEALGRDRYECHVWAVEQSGFDPSNPPPEPAAGAVRVPVGENPNQNAATKGTIAGAVAGGVIGAQRKDSGAAEGAVIGAVIGSMIGSAIEQQGATEARQQAEQSASQEAARRAAERDDLARARGDYQRALASCLEGRDYVVR
ncbi:MAG TPA: glycine zipper 2TM domain-containing protein [Gammaproteobacteria bacterium]|nr:glycine zipper 2TM domain-containing protein [Gammaproteobacteria bacterium]